MENYKHKTPRLRCQVFISYYDWLRQYTLHKYLLKSKIHLMTYKNNKEFVQCQQ